MADLYQQRYQQNSAKQALGGLEDVRKTTQKRTWFEQRNRERLHCLPSSARDGHSVVIIRLKALSRQHASADKKLEMIWWKDWTSAHHFRRISVSLDPSGTRTLAIFLATVYRWNCAAYLSLVRRLSLEWSSRFFWHKIQVTENWWRRYRAEVTIGNKRH